MQYLRGWRAMRNDPEWVGKVGIGSLIMLSAMCIPIFGQIVLLGWSALMLRRAVSGQDSPLPRLDFDFDYLGKLLQVGFKAFLARLLWSLPLMAVAMASVCCMYIAMGGAMASVAAGAGAGGDAGAGVGMVGALCIMGGFVTIYPLVMMALAMPMQIAIIRAELTDDVNAAMRFKEVIDMTKLLFKELFIGSFVMAGLGMLGAFFGIVTLYIGLFPAIVVLQIVGTYWHAELYKAYLEKGGQPLPVGPLDVPGGNLASAQQPPAQGPGQWGPPPQF